VVVDEVVVEVDGLGSTTVGAGLTSLWYEKHPTRPQATAANAATIIWVKSFMIESPNCGFFHDDAWSASTEKFSRNYAMIFWFPC
jgi:hypothetical protein